MRQQETVKGNAITPTEYKAFQQAYDFFNKQLFDKSLPPVLITLQRHAKMSGYFAPDRFTGRNGDNTTHEQSLNPDGFTGESDELILCPGTRDGARVAARVRAGAHARLS